MKFTSYAIVLAISMLSWTVSLAQNDTENSNSEKLEHLEASKEQILNEEKDALKGEVEQIHKRLRKEEITHEEAEQLKKKAAERRALNIENRLAIIDNRIELLKRNGTENVEGVDGVSKSFSYANDLIRDSSHRYKKDQRTRSEFVFAFGLNNVITEGQSLDDSDFKFGGSRFAELGWAWKTRVFKNSNWLRFKYGVSFQFNGLKPTDNRIFEKEGDQTILTIFPENLKKSKFRMDNLVIPVHFEFGTSTKVERDGGYVRYYTFGSIKFAVGGYAGINLGARQKLKYNFEGEEIKRKIKGGYNASTFVYGLSGYVGFRGAMLYFKYDLSPIFKDNSVAQRNISLGLRFDMD